MQLALFRRPIDRLIDDLQERLAKARRQKHSTRAIEKALRRAVGKRIALDQPRRRNGRVRYVPAR